MAVDYMAHYFGFESFFTKEKLSLSQGTLCIHEKKERVILCKPQGFMNLSGVCLSRLMRTLPIENLIVIHDDIALNPFVLKTKQGGGHGGHNGLRDIDQHIGKNYHRIRIGVGHPGCKDEVSSYVLSDFSKDEQGQLDAILKQVVDKTEEIVRAIVA